MVLIFRSEIVSERFKTLLPYNEKAHNELCSVSAAVSRHTVRTQNTKQGLTVEDLLLTEDVFLPLRIDCIFLGALRSLK